MKAKTAIFLIVMFFAHSLFAASGEGASRLNILTTHTVLKSLAQEIGGDHVSVSCLATGREDPHAIQAKPSYMVSARQADLFVKIGMELEIGYEQLVIDGSRNYKIRFGQPGHLDASLNVLRREVPTTRVDRSMGDVHPLGNPHYWLDPYNARIVARSIAERLAELDPTHAADYQAHHADFEKRLDTAMFGDRLVTRVGGDRLWSLELAGRLNTYLQEQGLQTEAGGWYHEAQLLKGMNVITYHRSWTYFAERFGINIIAELEPKPGIPPSPGHLRYVVDTAQRVQVTVILMEPYYNRKAAEFVAEKIGARVVEATNAVDGQPGVTDYFSLIDNIIRRLKEAHASSAT
ncbi:MAG: zinc ABC transporter substrate-binding protein [Candidatus Abyssubacteria bacterium]